jgi:hypothetical protein
MAILSTYNLIAGFPYCTAGSHTEDALTGLVPKDDAL